MFDVGSIVEHTDNDDDDQLSLELSSLRAAVARFQHEAHKSSLNLQRHSLDLTNSLERTQALEQENARLTNEIAVLRANPDNAPHPAALHAKELSLALRRVSDKLDLTEASLFARTSELAHARSDLQRTREELDRAYELASNTRAREEEGKARERSLELEIKGLDEDRRLTNNVVSEYAHLVRSLESRIQSESDNDSSSTTTTTTDLVGSLAEGKSVLQKLFQEFHVQNEALEAELARVNQKLAISESKRASEKKLSEHDYIDLCQAQFELEKLKIDDNTAARMVSRYMKYSQATVNDLQSFLESLKARHAATTSTLSSTINTLRHSLALSHNTTEKLRTALDELTADIVREVYGRRREVALRLALTTREERIAERLRRFARKAEEAFSRSEARDLSQVKIAFKDVVYYANGLLGALDGDPAKDSDPSTSIGSLSRIVVAESAVRMLVQELQVETARRMHLERAIASTSNGAGKHEPNDSVASSSGEQPEPEAVGPPESSDPSPANPPILSDDDSESTPLTEQAPPETAIVLPSQEIPPALQRTDIPVEMARSRQHTPLTDSQTDSQTDSLPRQLPPAFSASSLSTPSLIHNATNKSSDGININASTSSAPKHPLLAELGRINHRYDDLQHAFHDCHVALQELKRSMAQSLPAPPLRQISPPILQAAIERLNDYTEDTRVELEIRVADEALLARGFEALLCIPNAPSSSSPPSAPHPPHDNTSNHHRHHPDRKHLERDITAFINGTDQSVQKTLRTFTTKLDDIQHDIAAIKLAMHDPVLSDSQEGPADVPLVSESGSGSWSSWTAGILGGGGDSWSSKPLTPTFGNVMTTPRLRHSPSPDPSEYNASLAPGADPFARLGLRISMPAYVLTPSSTRNDPRSRTTSILSTLGLGLGPRSTLFSGGRDVTPRPASVGGGDEYLDVE